MTTDIDLRETAADDHRAVLFDALADTDAGETLEVVADDDVDPHLVRYQLDRERTLEWAYAHPDAEPRELQVRVSGPLEGGEFGSIDVRDLKPQRRHEVLLEIFDELAGEEGFVLVNDHDPKPLYHELRSMHGDVVGWSYERQDAGEWRVEIEKTADSEGRADDVVSRYDVREIPKAERHPTIHHRYGMIPAGETMELVAPHEPRPLLGEFRERYGDAFTWDVVEQEPGRCRVQITKTEDAAQEPGAEEGDDDSITVEGDSLEIVEEMDVRDLPPAQRHARIFAAYDELSGGDGFVLVNDHDPKPLYHQFDAEAGAAFRWAYLQRDPGEFKVLIGKADGVESEPVHDEPEAPF
ncbi:DUF2249 domain-containing protein [Natronoglomus mannanivorans]|uniref:DUF2249 domain-containing protein n=1 Tax=Natronoglomus mannanivorans TaxID=2979990 RepID=A0AAP3E3W0_9EURY|nr:DUF2249 domain-containing protein [Halobacteria archaeon AArc-xg1-1]